MEAPVDLLSLSFKEIQELEGEIGQKEFQRKYNRVLSLAASSLGESAQSDAADADRSTTNNNNNNNNNNSDKEDSTFSSKSKRPKKKTAEKWEPVEMSSKIKPKSTTSLHGSSMQRQKAAGIRDPRFDDVSGAFDEDLFEKGYAFLKDIKAEDERNLKKFIKVSKEEEKVEEAKNKLKAIKRASREETKEKKVEAKLKSLKKAEMAAVKEGKKPFFLKKSERKKLTLAEKFKELKQSGKLEKYMEKKRKRNAAKLKKALPSD